MTDSRSGAGAAYYRLPLYWLFTIRSSVFLFKIALSYDHTQLSYYTFGFTSLYIFKPTSFLSFLSLFNSFILTSNRFMRFHFHLYAVSYLFQLRLMIEICIFLNFCIYLNDFLYF